MHFSLQLRLNTFLVKFIIGQLEIILSMVFLDHTLAPFHPSDFPSMINRTHLECQFIESRLFDLSKQSTFFIPFASIVLFISFRL